MLGTLFLLLVPARAADFDTASVSEALPEEAKELLGDRDPTDSGGIAEALGDLILGAVERSREERTQRLGLAGTLLAIVILISLLRSLGSGISQWAMNLAGALAIGALCMDSLTGYYAETGRMIDSMTAFSGFLFTTMAATTAATGAVGTSTALYGGTVLLCSILTQLVERILLPAVSCYMALMLANSAIGEDSLKMAGDTLKQLVVLSLKLLVLGFTSYLSITGVICGSADGAAVKAAKLAISSVVPVVGGMMADASETLLVSAGMVRSSLGGFGLLGFLAMGLVPFLKAGFQYLSLKATAAAAGAVGEKQLSSLIGAMAGAMGLMTGITGACTLILMIGTVCFLRVGVT